MMTKSNGKFLATAEPPLKRGRCFRSFTELAPLAEAVGELSAHAASPMEQYAWMRACAAAFVNDRRLRIVAVERSGRLVGLASFVKRAGGAWLESPGSDELGEPAEVLYADAEGQTLLAREMLELGAPLGFPRVRADSRLAPALERAFRHRGVIVSRPTDPYPYIPLDESWRDPEARFNARHRSDHRRFRRRAEEIGPVSIDIVVPTPAALAPLLAEALGVEARSWKQRHGTAVVADPARATFYHNYAAAACEEGILRLCFLRLDGRAAAMQMAVEWAGGWWLLKIGYDEAFARCSPGTLLMLEAIRHAAQRGLCSIEFLGVVEPWTQVWTTLERECIAIRAYPATIGGGAALARDAASFVARRLLHKNAEET